MEKIKKIIMERDSLTSQEADELISEAQKQFDEYLAEGDESSAMDICMEFFGLEPDYIMEFIY